MSEDEPDILDVGAEDIKDILERSVVMPPVTVIGGHIVTGVNSGLITDEVVTTAELLALTPGVEGDQMAIFTLILDPELAQSLGIHDTQTLKDSK